MDTGGADHGYELFTRRPGEIQRWDHGTNALRETVNAMALNVRSLPFLPEAERANKSLEYWPIAAK